MTYKTKRFKDGQVASEITETGNLKAALRGNTYADLFQAASIKEAWDSNTKAHKHARSKLTLYCLIGQRSDRRFNENESFDLKVICDFINSMGYDEVQVFHPHSDVTLALIQNSKRISHFEYVKQAFELMDHPTLVSPDAGAYKTTHEIAEKLNSTLIPANKVRVDGKPHIQLQGDVSSQHCLIVDDILDGGRTFMELAKILKANGAASVSLYISHGIFSYGFDEIKKYVDHIYTTNSFQEFDNDFVTCFEVFTDH
jgi:ribose-phosphate pyrophosphokinase